ncbi:hypothetical protein [Bacillus sp. AFS055030]|uniref:hypothetical protein n=1 Tax=Bacillus sp. AFS055030 TaxID=2033507 RepID=UPI000BFC053F|nr:hypothetical protein [Bacillus sp. AFS055030]PGL72955.1 hypothetical protein CN925_01905 [Bacillus sp. AFS055030]
MSGNGQYYDTPNSTIRNNAQNDGFKIYIKFDEYRKEAFINNYDNTVFIESVTVWLLENSNEGFAARDVLEILLIAAHKPIFNKELRIDERTKIKVDEMLQQETNQTAIDNEKINGMSVKTIIQKK